MTSVIALVTAREARGLDEDLPPLEAALDAAGLETRVVDWDDPEASWASFDLALLRSTWDYTDRLREFLVWVDERSAGRALEHGQTLSFRARTGRRPGHPEHVHRAWREPRTRVGCVSGESHGR
jgi:hypothetical protein